MEIRVVRYEEQYRGQWDNLVYESINGTWLHSRAFYDHNPKNKEDDHSFMFFNGNDAIALLPGNIYVREQKKIFHSFLRATYGGFVVSPYVGLSDAVEIVSLLVQKARELMIDEIIVRNPFRIFSGNNCDETDYAMWYHGFTVLSREVETAIQLGAYQDVFEKFSSSSKRNIKKAAKNLTVKESYDFETFWPLLTQNLNDKHGLRPTHTLEEFKHLYALVGAHRIKLICSYLNDTMVAGIVLFVKNTRVVHAQYICSNEVYQEFRPLNAVIDYICKWACENSFLFLNLGTSNFDGGKGINEGLFRFKEGFGGRSVLRETMHLTLSR